MATDLPSTLDDKSCIKLIGSDMTKLAASKAFTEVCARAGWRGWGGEGWGAVAAVSDVARGQAGIKPSDINVVELHDCFSANEVRPLSPPPPRVTAARAARHVRGAGAVPGGRRGPVH